MTLAYFITHPDVVVDPAIPIDRWPLSETGLARMRRVLDQPWAASLRHVFSSAEQKALDGAEVLRSSLGIPSTVIPGLGENDRSATGFLPPSEFWPVVEEFFANPTRSIRGWERAADAQARVVRAVREGLAQTAPEESVAFVGHGGVGCLLRCQLEGRPISRAEEQPAAAEGSPPGSGGGHYFAFDRSSLALAGDWQPIDVPAGAGGSHVD